MVTDILALVSIVSVIVFLDRFVNILPSLAACMVRWKESLNLEASIKSGRDRDLAAMLMFIPFCLIISSFRMYCPDFMRGMDETARLGSTSAAFVAYILLRLAMTYILRPRKMNPAVYKAAHKLSLNFFTMLTLILLGMAGTMSFAGICPSLTRSAMLWVSALVYILFLIRKTQIFLSSCSLFTAFSYLCGLEIIPTGAFIVSAIVF